MYGLLAGRKKVAVVERWPLVGVQLYFFCRPVNSKTARAMYPLPAKCWHLVFLKNFRQIRKYVGSLDGQMPHRYRASKSVKSPTNQRLLKNFPMRQIVYSNVACIASVSVWFRSKEIPRKGIFGFDRARNQTRAKK